MKPKIELNREYPTREGGIGVVHFIDSDRLIGRIKHSGCDFWVPKCWHSDGLVFVDTHSHSDLLLPRTVMVPITVPEWVRSVRVNPHGVPSFCSNLNEDGYIPVEDWIASLEGEDE